MDSNATFGCGSFLPGRGPGNFPEYTWGSTIDVGTGTGGGNNGGGGGGGGGGGPPPPLEDIADQTPIGGPPGGGGGDGGGGDITIVPLELVQQPDPTPVILINQTYQNQTGTIYELSYPLVCRFIYETATSTRQAQIEANISLTRSSAAQYFNSLNITNQILIGSIGQIGRTCSFNSVGNTLATYTLRYFVVSTPPPPTYLGFILQRNTDLDNPTGDATSFNAVFGRRYVIGYSKVCSLLSNPNWQTDNQITIQTELTNFLNQYGIGGVPQIYPDTAYDLINRCTSNTSPSEDYITAFFIPVGGALQAGSSGGGLRTPSNQSQNSTGIKTGITSTSNSGRGLVTASNPRTSSTTTFGIKDTQNTTITTNSGRGLFKRSEEDYEVLLDNATSYAEIDLNDPKVIQAVLDKNPAGVQDIKSFWDTHPSPENMTDNDTGYSVLFADRIDSAIYYALKYGRSTGGWSSKIAPSITENGLYRSLKPEVVSVLDRIKNYDGSKLTRQQVFDLLGSRILDGTIGSITYELLESLAEDSEKRTTVVFKKSHDQRVNDVAAISYIENNMYLADPAGSIQKMRKVLPNWKILSSDVDRHFLIDVNGSLNKYFIKDDDTFISNSSYHLEDGDYFNIDISGVMNRYYTTSERDHAYIISEEVRQKAVTLLGGNTYRTLEVSAPMDSGIDYDYSLSSPRENFYILKAILSSLESTPTDSGSFLLKNSRLRYELMDSKTAQGLQEINDYIKYKVNHRVFIIDDEDLMLDYIEQTSSVYLSQVDITFDSLKQNKTTPLLLRQVPWYILVYPTNRAEYNLFNSKSFITSIDPSGSVVRSMNFNSSITPEFSRSDLNKFVVMSTDGIDAVNVYGETDPQTRIMKLITSDTVFSSGYKKDNAIVSAKEFTPTRKKTGLRVVKEIIQDYNSNYYLNLDGAGSTVTENEVFSKMTFNEYTRFARLENFKEIRKKLRTGLIEGVKVIPTINKASSKVTLTASTPTGQKEFFVSMTVTPVAVPPPISEVGLESL